MCKEWIWLTLRHQPVVVPCVIGVLCKAFKKNITGNQVLVYHLSTIGPIIFDWSFRRPFFGCNDFLLPMLVWKALVLTQKITKLTQSINRSPLGQKIPDLLLEQLKATKSKTKKTSQCERGWSQTCPWWSRDHSGRALCRGRDSWQAWTFLTWIYLWKRLHLLFDLIKGSPVCSM